MHLSFSKLGSYGRLGNQLFEIAGTIGLATKHNLQASFPKWEYEKHFVNAIPHGQMMLNQIKEQHFHVHDWDIPKQGADILGYLQSEKYFDADTIKKQFTFKPELLKAVKDKVPANLFDKETIVFQIRRGDYVNNQNYYQLSIEYYIDALLTHFANWSDCNIVFFSDDLNYCKVHFECMPNAYFTDGLTDIEQMALATMCDHFIIPNSSYGWWCAWLGEKKHSKIVHCGHLQAGKLLEQNDPKDYWPERWIKHEKAMYKIPLHDVTFSIPVYFDHSDRKKNLDLSLCMLQKSFESNFIVGEQGGEKFKYVEQWAQYVSFSGMQQFHRTKMLNDMALMASTPFIVNWDCDIILPPMQVYLMALELRSGAQFIYPFDGRFLRIPRIDFNRIESNLDIGFAAEIKFKGRLGGNPCETSVGGAVAYEKDAFIDAGMENEKMISYGPEDVERIERWNALGFTVKRNGGALYHLDHFIGVNSGKQNPHFKANHEQLEKQRKMTATELRNYVDTWEWRHMYTPAYYRRISEGSEQSAMEVFKALEPVNVKPKKVADIGCGAGAWVQKGIEWVGVDYGIPKKAMYEGVEYVESDLTKQLPNIGKFDLAICMEVAEHLPIERAKPLIEYLCSLAPKVLFSAAIPKQGGTGHINEQWQTWWAELFEQCGYAPAKKQPDIVGNKNIELWYRQNTVLYEKGGKGTVKDFVLPEYYEQITKAL